MSWAVSSREAVRERAPLGAFFGNADVLLTTFDRRPAVFSFEGLGSAVTACATRPRGTDLVRLPVFIALQLLQLAVCHRPVDDLGGGLQPISCDIFQGLQFVRSDVPSIALGKDVQKNRPCLRTVC